MKCTEDKAARYAKNVLQIGTDAIQFVELHFQTFGYLNPRQVPVSEQRHCIEKAFRRTLIDPRQENILATFFVNIVGNHQSLLLLITLALSLQINRFRSRHIGLVVC